MTTLQALKVTHSPQSYVPIALGLSNAGTRVGGATTSVTAAAHSSASVQMSTQALNLYNASVAKAATSSYSVAQALAIGTSASAGSIAISDTAANISKGFDRLVAIAPKISAIEQTDVKAIAINEAQFSAGLTSNPEDGLLYKINSNQFKVAISGVHTANLTSIASYGDKVVVMALADTSANIVDSLAEIAVLGTKVSVITQTSRSALALSYANTVQYANTLSKIDKGSYKLNLTDTASNIKINLAAITKLDTKVSTITQTDAPEAIAVNMASVTNGLTTLKKINSGSFKISIEDNAAAITKSWAVLLPIQKNISSLKLTDAVPVLRLTAAQAQAGEGLINNITNNTLQLTVADTATNLSANLEGILALDAKVTKVTQTGVGNIAVTQSQLASEALTSFLGKLVPTNYSLAVSGADKTNIAAILANTHVKSVSLSVTDGTLTSSDADTNTALQNSKITTIAVSNAKIVNLGALGTDKRVKSIGITDSAANLTNAANLVTLDALMKKTKGIVSSINVDADSRQLISVAQTTYTKYATTVFSAPKNYALEVDLGAPTASRALTQDEIRTALKTTSNNQGGFGVQVWDFTKGKYAGAVALNAGVNFVKLGTTSTFLDSGDAKLNAVLNVGGYKWQQNPGQATAGTSDYALKPGVFSLGSDSANPIITYKYLSSTSDGKLSAKDKVGFSVMNTNQKSAVTSALNYISSLVNITFKLIENGSQADINFATNDQGTTSGGYATGANSAMGTVNLLLNNKSSVNTQPQQGDYGWETIIHEIGHTLGLKHPGAYNAGGGVPAGPYLSETDDNRRNTVMSYKNPSDAAINWVSNGNSSYVNSGVNPGTFMPLDILALQFLYGKNVTGISSSDSSKGLSNFQTTQFNSSWSGIETISSAPQGLALDLSAVNESNIVDMRAGAFSSINIKDTSFNAGIGGSKTPQTFYNFNNVGLAYDASVSRVVGGSSADVVYVSNNSVEIDGNTGLDKVFLYGRATDWTQSSDADQTTYTNDQVTVKLKNVESIGYYALTSSPQTHSRIDLSV